MKVWLRSVVGPKESLTEGSNVLYFTYRYVEDPPDRVTVMVPSELPLQVTLVLVNVTVCAFSPAADNIRTSAGTRQNLYMRITMGYGVNSMS